MRVDYSEYRGLLFERPEAGVLIAPVRQVDDDRGRARRIAAEAVGGGYGQDFSHLGRYLVAGTPSDCQARLREPCLVHRKIGPRPDLP